MPDNKPVIDSQLILHRGASAYAPENTLEALHLAAQMGATWVETDVRDTADGELVMMHDENVNRTTDGAGRVAQLSLNAIQEFDAGGWFSGRYRGSRIPTLREYLTMAQDLKLGLVLELKDVAGWEERLSNLVSIEVLKIWKSDPQKLVISAFSERCLQMAKCKLEHHPRCLAVTAMPESPGKRLAEAGAHMMHLQHSFAREAELEQLSANGMEFGFATVNNPDRARYLLEKGASSILTDKPDLLDGSAGASPV